ncbi:MAG: acyltransferase [Lachnospiraceae bacterium]|nr:acyltransferase [Lachnospiraceae bacterium]
MNTTKQQRNSAVELLRILCILMVIAGHYYAHGIAYAMAPFALETYSPRILALQLISFGADIANDIFIIITGYYMVNSTIKGKRIAKLFGEMLFYAWVIALVFHLTGLTEFTQESLLKTLLPFWSGENWFVTCYILLCLLIPFLNPFIKTLEQKSYVKLLAILFAIRFIAPMLGTKTFWSTAHGLEQFILLYFIGAYIKLHGFQTKLLQNKWSWRIILILLVTLWFAVSAGTTFLGIRTQNNELIADTTRYFPIFSILISPVLLIVVLGLKPFYSKFINLISGSVLAVYLIHDNPLVRNYIWWTVSPNINQIGSNHVFIHMIQKVLIVFVVCVLIDQCRLWLFEKPFTKFKKTAQ